MSLVKKTVNLLKKRWYLILLLFAAGGIIYWKLNSNPSSTKKENPYEVKRQTLKTTLSLSGKIDAEEKVVLRFQTSGKLVWVGVKEGDYVKKYQSIASLDQRELQENLQKYLRTYLKSRWDFEQTKDDYKNTTTTTEIKRILDQAQFDLDNSVSDVKLRNLAIDLSHLWTPIEGLVVKVDSPLPGVNITPTQAEFQIINPHSVYFSATADQTDVVKLKNVKTGSIIFDSYPDKEIPGHIKYISFVPKSGESGTVYEIKITFQKNNSDYAYRLGMAGDITFVVKEIPNKLSIPSVYVNTEAGKKYVYKKSGNGKTKTEVTTGEETDDLVEIISGLEENDIVY